MTKKFNFKKFSLAISVIYLFLLASNNCVIAHCEDKELESQFDASFFIEQMQNVSISKYNKAPEHKKAWTLMIYIAADNDLKNFALRSLKQLAEIGSNEFINIVVHIDFKLAGNKVTRRYYIEKGKILHMNDGDPETQRMDSGNPETLISFAKWAIPAFPAENFAIDIWDHATGCIDPLKGRVFKVSDLFVFNSATNKFEVNRGLNFFENIVNDQEKGICWDDTTGNYMTTRDLDYALNEIYTKILGNKKFAFVGFDACLMQMTEIANVVKKYADFMIGSEEVILATSWDYVKTLNPFITGSMEPEEFCRHIVNTYKSTYESITDDFTLSAIRLENFAKMEEAVNIIAKLLVECLKKQKNRSVKNTIGTCRSKLLCTYFDEPSFIDLHHFYKNILASLKNFDLVSGQELKTQLENALNNACKLIEEFMIANVCGKNLSKARGLSIYFPLNRIYPSYRELEFCKNNEWITFLTYYLSA